MTTKVRYTQPLLGEANPAGYLVAVPGASVEIRQNGVQCDVYGDNAGTPMINPVPTGVPVGTAGVDVRGTLVVYLDPGSGYDAIATAGTESSTFVIGDVAPLLGDVVPAFMLQGGTPGSPTALTTLWSWLPANNYNTGLAPFSMELRSNAFGSPARQGPYLSFGYNVLQAQSGEPAAFMSIFADAEDTPGGALQMQWNINFPDNTNMLPLKVVANRDNTHTCSIQLFSGAGGGGILLAAAGAGGPNGPNYITCNGAGSGVGNITIEQPTTFYRTVVIGGQTIIGGTVGGTNSTYLRVGNNNAVANPAIIELSPPTGQNGQINWLYGGVAQWQLYQNGGGPLFLRDMVRGVMTATFATGGSAGVAGQTTIGGPLVGAKGIAAWNHAAPSSQPVMPADATDLASVITLANALKSMAVGAGFAA